MARQSPILPTDWERRRRPTRRVPAWHDGIRLPGTVPVSSIIVPPTEKLPKYNDNRIEIQITTSPSDTKQH